MHGDPESLPNMPFQQWRDQPGAVWVLVSRMLRDGWWGRVQSYYSPNPVPGDWIDYDCALYCQSLGAPVGRFFTAAAIMVRDRGAA